MDEPAIYAPAIYAARREYYEFRAQFTPDEWTEWKRTATGVKRGDVITVRVTL